MKIVLEPTDAEWQRDAVSSEAMFCRVEVCHPRDDVPLEMVVDLFVRALQAWGYVVGVEDAREAVWDRVEGGPPEAGAQSGESDPLDEELDQEANLRDRGARVGGAE